MALPSFQLTCVLRTELQTPLVDGFVGHGDSSFGELRELAFQVGGLKANAQLGISIGNTSQKLAKERVERRKKREKTE